MSIAAACPLCGSLSPRPLAVQRGFAWGWCAACDFSFLSPQPSRGELAEAYQGYLPGGERGVEAWRQLMAGIFRETLGVLGSPAPGARLLDVGCAYGFFLEAAAARGWEAQGIDLCAHAVARARERGLRADEGAVEEVEFEEGAFDAVTLFYVLEHVPDPRAALRRVFRWLAPGGRLLLRVPHTAPLVKLLSALGIRNELLDPPFHLADFSPRSLGRLLEEVGFVEIRTFPGAPTRPDPLLPRVTAQVASGLARVLHSLSGGRYLLPGVSKTSVATKSMDL